MKGQGKEKQHMKRQLRRLLAFVLALALVMGYMPASTIQAQAATKVSVKSLKLNKTQYVLKKGEKLKLKATVSPKKAAVTWKSSNKKVATVSSKGVVKAVASKGTATITAKSGKKKATCKITIGTPVKKITASNLDLIVGESKKISASVSPKNAKVKTLVYESKDKSVATVSKSGTVKAKKAGTTKIVITAKDRYKVKKTITIKVSEKQDTSKKATVTPTEKPKQIAVTGVTMIPENAQMKVTETLQLNVNVLPENASNKKVSFSVVSGANVVSVDEKGLVTAKSAGNAVVKVSTEDGKKEASCAIKVTSVLRDLNITTESGASVIEAGSTEKLIVQEIPEGSKIKLLKYQSSKEECATVDEEGVITAIQNGSFSIIVTAVNEEDEEIIGEIDLRVGTHVQSLELNTIDTMMFVGDHKQLEAKVLPTTANERQVLFSSSDEGVVTVTETGLMEAVAAGSAEITATTTDGGIQQVCKVNVEEAAIMRQVSNQEELNEALQTEGLQILEISTEEAVTIQIPEGNYENTSLVVDAKEAHIENSANFKSIKIQSIGQNTFVEKSQGNEIYYGAATGTIQVAEEAVSCVYLVEGAGKLKLLEDGQIAGVTLNTKAELSIGGNSNSVINITATALAEESSIVTSKKLLVEVRSSIELSILSGAEETEVSTNTKENIPRIRGLGRIQVTIEQIGDIEFIVAENNVISEITQSQKKLAVTGKVVSGTDNAISGAKVYLIAYVPEITQENVESYAASASYTGETDENGQYLIADVAVGNYILLVQKEEYQNIMETVVLTNTGSDTYTAEMIYMLKAGETATGNLTGVLYNAQDGNPVTEGITVRIRSGKNNVSGDYLAETVTDSNGVYSFENLIAGQYTVHVIDYREGVEEVYITTQFNAVVLPNENNVKNSTITAVIGSEQIRFVLRWGDEASGASSDLDSHLIGPAYQSVGEFHTWFSDQSYSVTLEDDSYLRCADLDVDDTTWEGPETSTIYTKETGEYRFYVHDYTNMDNMGCSQMGNSVATVEVYKGARLKATYHVPNEPGNLWYVCKYNAIEDVLTEVGTVSDWDESLQEIGMDRVLLKKTQLSVALEKAKVIVPLLTDQTIKQEFSNLIEEAQKAYEESEDVTVLKTILEELNSWNSEFEDSVAIYGITGEEVIGYYVTEENVVSISGYTAEIPEYQVNVNSQSIAEIKNLTDGEYSQAIVVTGKGGYSCTYPVMYERDLQEILGIRNITEATDDNLEYYISELIDGEYKEIEITGYNETLGEQLVITPKSSKATVNIEEADKEEYLKKVTISYEENSAVYYIKYAIDTYVFSIKNVTDGENVILEWAYMSWGGYDDLPLLTVKGLQPQLSDDFSVTTRGANVNVDIKESDVSEYAKKLELSYGGIHKVCYVRYEQKADAPYLISVTDKDNFNFKTEINQSQKTIQATGLNEQISGNLEIVVPEGMTYEVDTDYISWGEIYITVKNSQGETAEYELYYTEDLETILPTGIEDPENEILEWNYQYDSIYILGVQKKLSENAVFQMPEGVTAEVIDEDGQEKLSVSLIGTAFTKTFYINYEQDDSGITISGIADKANNYVGTPKISTYSTSLYLQEEVDGISYEDAYMIYVYGENAELGNSYELTIPEGSSIESTTRVGDEAWNYNDIVRSYDYWDEDDNYISRNYTLTDRVVVKAASGVTRVYVIAYAQDDSGTVVSGIVDAENDYVEKPEISKYTSNMYFAQEVDGVSYEEAYVIYVCGSNERLGTTYELTVPEGSSIESITHVGDESWNYSNTTINHGYWDENDNYISRNYTLTDRVIVKAANGIERVYVIAYLQDDSGVVISNFTDAENSYIVKPKICGYSDNLYFREEIDGISYEKAYMIYVYGNNTELGNTYQLTIPEGSTIVSTTHVGDESWNYSDDEVDYDYYDEDDNYISNTYTLTERVVVKAANGVERIYVIAYAQDESGVKVSGLKDKNNIFSIEPNVMETFSVFSVNNGDNTYTQKKVYVIEVVGGNETLGNTYELELPEEAEIVSVSHAGDEGWIYSTFECDIYYTNILGTESDGYAKYADEVIVRGKNGAERTYLIAYLQDDSGTVVQNVIDEENEGFTAEVETTPIDMEVTVEDESGELTTETKQVYRIWAKGANETLGADYQLVLPEGSTEVSRMSNTDECWNYIDMTGDSDVYGGITVQAANGAQRTYIIVYEQTIE